MSLVSRLSELCSDRGRAARRRVSPWAGLLALLGLVGVATSCTTAPYCEELSKCGGDLIASADSTGVSEWVATSESVCMDQLQPPVNPVSISQQPAPNAGDRAADQATVDWCSSLSQQANGTLSFQGYFPVIPIENFVLTLHTDSSYLAHFISRAPQQMQFSQACRVAQGINFTCPELGRNIQEAIAPEANVYNTRCYDDGAGGCTCDYDLVLYTSLPGNFGAADGIITFYDQSNAPSAPAPADYCLKGDSLEITGHDGQRLFNKANLRTLSLHRPSCSDGLQDQGETGIDCGGPCEPCGTCDDGIQNQDETGVDCGGTCPDFCACFNGKQDPWEEGVDCGGPCSLPCTCTNGVHDPHEGDAKHPNGVDCGGRCEARHGKPITCQ